MKAIILAAGQGNRLGSLTEELPKGLVKVAGKELILHTLAFLRHPAVHTIGCVTGTHADRLKGFLKENAPGVAVFENKDYKEGNILTLLAALDFLDDDFLLLNTDHIYPKVMLDKILTQRNGLTAVCDFHRRLQDDDMKIALNPDRTVRDIDKKLEHYDAGYIGMTFCPRSKLSVYKEALERTLEKRGRKACVEAVLSELAKQGEKISIADTTPLEWLEVDTEQDLELAERRLPILNLQTTG